MKKALKVVVKLVLAFAAGFGATLLVRVVPAHGQEFRTLLPGGDTLVVQNCPQERHWIAMRSWEPEGALAWNRVYPYVKPIALDLGARKPEWYTAVGFGYRVGDFTSLSFEWKGVYGKPDALSLSTKLSIR